MQIEEGVIQPRLKAEEDNILGDLYNCSHHTKAEFNNCFIMHSKMFVSSYSATYCNQGHLDKVVQSDYKKITINSEKVGCQS